MDESANDSPTSPPAAQNQSSSGCSGKTCLFGCLGITIAGAVVVIALFFVGKAYIDRQLPVWKEQYPELELALNALEHVQTLQEHAGEIQEMTSMMSSTAGASTAEVPGDIPRFDDPLEERIQTVEGRLFIFQRLPMTADVTAIRIEGDFTSNGWTARLINTPNQQFWDKKDTSCEVEIDEAQSGSDMRMMCERTK